MKKSALTIVLFSLVMVATSFTTPQTSNSSSINGIDGGGQKTGDSRKIDLYDIDGGGQKTGDSRKIDLYDIDGGGQKTGDSRKIDLYRTGNSFGADRQSTGAFRKLD